MDMRLLVLVAGSLSILVIEWLLWRLFRRRAGTLISPGDSVPLVSHKTIIGLRIAAALHTLLLLGVFIFSVLFLW